MTMAETRADVGRTTIQVSEELADELHSRKDRGDSYEDVINDLIEKVDQADRSVSEETEPPARTQEQNEPEPSVSDQHREQLAEELAGSGDLLERRVDEVLKMYHELRDRGEAEKDDLLDVVDVSATEYDGRDSVWSNMIKGRDTLRALPGVEKPATGKTTWRYKDDRS